MAKTLRVVYCSSEVEPFAKTGGLADVAGSLPRALKKLGLDIIIFMPKYRGIRESKDLLYNEVPVYFIENDAYFDREFLYGTKEGDYPDNLERFSFFCRKVLAKLKELNFSPDIIHCNDWQTALIPVYLKILYTEDSFFTNTKTIFTIHNLAYQGLFPAEDWDKLALPKELFNINGLEYYGKINIMKGAIIFADYITTVSPTYSKEIQTPEYGCGLEGVLASRRKDLGGILNGLDYEIWDPAKDKSIVKRYNKRNLKAKAINKKFLQSESNMDIGKNIPLIGAVGRLTDQKGWDLIADIIEQLCHMELQIVILGLGEKKYHDLMQEIAQKYPRNTSINLKFDDQLARRIYAGSDFFLMPSKFEPCGLGQLISYRYGTIPIAHATGGLVDTIIDYNSNTQNGTGFLFKTYNSSALLDAIKRALNIFQRKAEFENLKKKVMELDFSWKKSAQCYLELYQELKDRAIVKV